MIPVDLLDSLLRVDAILEGQGALRRFGGEGRPEN
jgi:hypothetical protein